MPYKIVVLGGSGFIGKDVCRIAALQGHEVVSVSRTGRPEGTDGWGDRVTWHSADVLLPETWRDALDGAHAVIHSVGTISEDPDEGVTFERVNGDSVELSAWEAEQAGVDRSCTSR